MAYVLKELSRVNNFTHVRYGNPDHRLISRKGQVTSILNKFCCYLIILRTVKFFLNYPMCYHYNICQAKMIYSLLKKQQRPLAYDRHVYFFDFRNFCKMCQSPTWIRQRKYYCNIKNNHAVLNIVQINIVSYKFLHFQYGP